MIVKLTGDYEKDTICIEDANGNLLWRIGLSDIAVRVQSTELLTQLSVRPINEFTAAVRREYRDTELEFKFYENSEVKTKIIPKK